MDNQKFIDRLENDVGFFAHNILYKRRWTLAPKQISLIESFRNDNHTVGIFSRQSGKSESLAVYDTHELCFGKDKNGEPDHTILYAPSLPQTSIVMGRVHQFFNTIPILKGYVQDQLKRTITMKNGNTLHTLSASEQAHVDGYSPTKIQIDEAQDVNDRLYYEGILPSGAATGAKIQEIGTPKRRNHFYQLTRIKTGVSVITQKWTECPFIDKEYVLRRKARMPRAKFDAAFNCIFLTDVDVAFATEMLDAIIKIDPDELDGLPDMQHYFLGGDIGKQDETVFVILGWSGNKLYQVDLRRLSAFKSYKLVFDEIIDLYDEYNIANGLVDMTGVGEGIIDMLPQTVPVEGVFLSNEEKQEIVDEFMKLGEGDVDVGFDPKVEFWKDYDLRQQFYEWEAKKLKSGKTRYHHPKGSNDDIVIAALLACKAYVDENEVVDYGSGSSVQNVRQGLSVLNNNDPNNVLRHGNPYTS
ncbi:MAG: hypothetical protein ACTSSE_08570 [Candidatus Thorarchaeota archaeon]